MTRGADIIAAIILLALAIAIIVYLLHWLYRRSSKEVSFVRTGMLGEKVVISGGAFVLPIIHNITQVGMRTLSINIKRSNESRTNYRIFYKSATRTKSSCNCSTNFR